MPTWPKTYAPEDAPGEVLRLSERLMPRLLAGEHPTMATLREQYERARIVEVELSGAGFFVDFHVPDDLPRVDPPRLAGGDATLRLEGLEHGMGCVLFVADGKLDGLDVHTYQGSWPETKAEIEIGDVRPLAPLAE